MPPSSLRLSALGALLGAAAGAVGCTREVCAPREEVAGAGHGGAPGAQAGQADGKGYEPCQCPGQSSSSSSGGTGGAGGAGTTTSSSSATSASSSGTGGAGTPCSSSTASSSSS